MIVDVHTHMWDRPEQMGPGTAKRLAATGDAPWDRLNASPEAYDAAMAPTDHSIILGFHSVYLDAAISHEQVARYVARDPAKYIGFAGIDPMVKDCLGSLNEAQDLGLKGVIVSPAAQGYHPTHTRAMRLYEECQERGLPVVVHPGTHLDKAAVLEFSQPHLLDAVGREFPELRLVLAQAGHPWADSALWMVAKHRHFYADLSDLTQRPWQLYNVLLLAYQQDVIDHLLLGSDFPFSTPEAAAKTIYSVNHHTQGTQLPTIPREQLRSIVERDALACLGLAVESAAPEPEALGPEPEVRAPGAGAGAGADTEVIELLTPEPEAPEPLTPEPEAPEPLTPEPEAPEPLAPEAEASEPLTPEAEAPEALALVEEPAESLAPEAETLEPLAPVEEPTESLAPEAEALTSLAPVAEPADAEDAATVKQDNPQATS